MNPDQDTDLSTIYPPRETVEVATRAASVVWAEGALYFIIGALTPVVPILDSDRPLDARNIAAIALTGLLSGAVSLKAFFSNSISRP